MLHGFFMSVSGSERSDACRSRAVEPALREREYGWDEAIEYDNPLTGNKIFLFPIKNVLVPS